MYVWILHHDGAIVVHRNLPTSPEALLTTMAPARENMVIAVECLVTWSWLADLCAREGLPVVRGHALDMKALHGGNATHDNLDAQHIAVLLRGGMRPHADVYPAALRATRALLRRRRPLMRQRAELLTHVPQTNRQDNLPAIGTKIAYKANRTGVAARCADPAVQPSLAVDRALIDHDDRVLNDLEWSLLNTATQHEAQTLYRRQTVPGIGKILRRVRR